jgi:DNA invertase Pin-like site-specific DNA recombinase
MGHVVLTVLGMVAQMERRFILERQREGIGRAKAAGVYRGGKPRLDFARIRALRRAGLTPTQIARETGCSRMQVYRVLAIAEHGTSNG